jgi:tripartite-type tricarboxylate transporter receptor subunit TctC
MVSRRQLFVSGLVTASVFAAGSAWSQAYPNRMIRLQVPFAPGGTTDIIARVMSEPLGRVLGQSVIVENRAGAGGVVGATELARATPDGYTIGMATVSTTAANPAINPKITYNTLTDFTPIINIAATPNVIAVHPSFPARDYKSFLAEIKKSPGKYSYASSGVGGIGHLQTELFKSLTGTFITHIPYRGIAPATLDTISGQLQLLTGTIPALAPHIRDGKLKALAVTSPERSAALPNVPGMKEAGMADFNVLNYFALVAPKGTPDAVVQQINAALARVVQMPDVKERLAKDALEPAVGSPAQLGQFLQRDLDGWKAVVKQQGLKIETF